MKKDEMITIQMSKEEAKGFGNTLMEAIMRAEALEEILDDLMDLATPVILAVEGDSPMIEKGVVKYGEEEKSDCESCSLPCENNPNWKDKEGEEEKAEESEEEVLAIEILKAVFSALTDLLENGE